DVIGACVAELPQSSFGPRAFRLPFSATMVLGIVNQERDSRAVHREFGAADRGLAVDGGMMTGDESYRENRTGGKKAEATRSRAEVVSAWRANSWVGGFALKSRLPALNTFRTFCLKPEIQEAIGQLKQLNWAG